MIVRVQIERFLGGWAGRVVLARQTKYPPQIVVKGTDLEQVTAEVNAIVAAISSDQPLPA